MPAARIVSPAAGSTVSGEVEVVVEVSAPASAVTVTIGEPGYADHPATSLGGGRWAARWDTTAKASNPAAAVPGDALYWLGARAEIGGRAHAAALVPVTTGNDASATAAAAGGGWRPALAWAARYDGTFADWKASLGASIGTAHASLRADPVLGGRRKAIRVALPDSAVHDADQPKDTTVRFQAGSPRRIVEGDEFCVGFASLLPPSFPEVYAAGDPTNPRGPGGTGYIAIFQLYGPPYAQGSPLVLHANRRSIADPLGELSIRGNELNPGDPTALLALPYRRGAWTDVVLRIRASTSIERGWIEVWINQGESRAVRRLTINGRTRTPRVLLRGDSQAFRTDMQQYRVLGHFASVSTWHTAHRIARTVAEADPGSYRTGPLS